MQTKAVRIEQDLLGEKEIPYDAYYGIQTMRAAENFSITGYRLHRELIQAMATVKKAAALANMETGDRRAMARSIYNHGGTIALHFITVVDLQSCKKPGGSTTV